MSDPSRMTSAMIRSFLVAVAVAAVSMVTIGCDDPVDVCPSACARAFGECFEETQLALEAVGYLGVGQADCIDGCIEEFDAGGEDVAACLNDGESCTTCAVQFANLYD